MVKLCNTDKMAQIHHSKNMNVVQKLKKYVTWPWPRPQTGYFIIIRW